MVALLLFSVFDLAAMRSSFQDASAQDETTACQGLKRLNS